MDDFKVVLPTTTEEWQRDMNIAYNQALEDFIYGYFKYCEEKYGRSADDEMQDMLEVREKLKK